MHPVQLPRRTQPGLIELCHRCRSDPVGDDRSGGLGDPPAPTLPGEQIMPGRLQRDRRQIEHLPVFHPDKWCACHPAPHPAQESGS